ncbi:MAG: hypothetical protein ABIO88_04500 [Burkholderiaceae bacterium]
MNFFLDNNLPPNWSGCLRASSLNHFAHDDVDKVVHLKEKFKPSTPDIDWIKNLATEKNWTIISLDAFRKQNGAERKVLRQSGLSLFVLQSSWANHQYWEKTAQLLRWWPRIVEQANSVDGAAFEVPWRTTGKFKQI